jgi:hypothetical protein
MTGPNRAGCLGYRSRAYAEALGMAEGIIELPASGGQLLTRRLQGRNLTDACGAYPVFSCATPSRLGEDIGGLGDDLVSVTLVADPLTPWDTAALAELFPVMRALADHYVIDLGQPGHRPSSHHRRKLRQAAGHNTEIRIEADPLALAPQWTNLYAVLIGQVGITGLRRFSPEIFRRMLAVPGTVLFTAWDGGTLLGADWYFEDGDRIYAHLSAYAESGYARAVSYPMMDAALRHFAARGARVLDLGGVPLVEGGGRGLAQFKQGWSTRTLPCRLCGRVLNPARYAELTAAASPLSAEYFPRYRHGEFG